jgi:hypothetical protein
VKLVFHKMSVMAVIQFDTIRFIIYKNSSSVLRQFEGVEFDANHSDRTCSLQTSEPIPGHLTD